MLEVSGLRKSYGAVTAVAGISFRAQLGESIGFLGPNGAGKTTSLSMIAGLLQPDAGEVRINGQPMKGDTHPAKRNIGFVPQDVGLYEQVSARENLHLFGALYGMRGATLKRAADEALELVGLSDRAGSRVREFSGGMKRRLNLAASLLHDPQLLLLDEPTVGVDPQSRNAIFENLEELKKRGKTILYTTHYMEEAERLCERLLIVDHGKIIVDDTLDHLRRTAAGGNVLIVELENGPGDGEFLEGLRRVEGVESAEIYGQAVRIGVRDLAADTGGILAWLAQRGYRFGHLTSERNNLESVFLSLTGRSLRD